MAIRIHRLYLYSNTKGSGKTRMAISIGNALMKVKRKGVKYTTTIDLLDEIKKTFDKDSQLTESELIESIKKIDVKRNSGKIRSKHIQNIYKDTIHEENLSR